LVDDAVVAADKSLDAAMPQRPHRPRHSGGPFPGARQGRDGAACANQPRALRFRTGGSRSPGGEREDRDNSLLVSSSANAGGPSSADAPAPTGEKDQGQVWFEHTLSTSARQERPTPSQAFEMRRSTDLGHTQAEFNVVAILDSGCGAPRDVARAAIWYYARANSFFEPR
jgi:hypothetical protein